MRARISNRTSVVVAIALAATMATVQSPAPALDKQASAHGGDVEGASSGFAVSGNLVAGWSLYNPTYAARPNNTGLTFFRAAGHLDLDLVGRSLSIPLDVNFFTDRLARPAVRSLVPSELDVITGLVSTWRLGPGALEAGARIEHDMGLDDGRSEERRVGKECRL